jgi:hypothetical protein
VYQRTAVVAQNVVSGNPILTASLSESVTDARLANQKLFFTLGRTAGGRAIPCTGSGSNADGSATTDANGSVSCNISFNDLLAVVGAGYTATFKLTPPYFGSSDDAGL